MADVATAAGRGGSHEVMSSASRLVAGALDLAAACACHGPPQIHVLRGFGRRSRLQAHQVRARLRAEDEVVVCDEAIPMATLEFRPVEHHVCVFVAASTPTGEAERIAALNEVPIVVATPSATQLRSFVDEQVPVLVAASGIQPGGAQIAVPSASGSVPNVALDSYEIVGNQPEHGELSLYLRFGPGRLLEPGSSLTIRPLPETSIVEVINPHGRSSVWFSDTVEIRQRAGAHRILRDQLSVADLPDTLTIQHRSRGLHRRSV